MYFGDATSDAIAAAKAASQKTSSPGSVVAGLPIGPIAAVVGLGLGMILLRKFLKRGKRKFKR